MNEEQHYTDFSCRTPMERLAGAIEVTLRDWHLHLNDRHVSSEMQQDRSQPQTPIQGLTRKRSSIKLRNSMVKDKVDVLQDVTLIRSKELMFQGNIVTLNLWDGPLSHVNDSTSSSINQSNNEGDDALLDIPLSLQSITTKLDTSIPHDLVRNLSTLFGIGQHITLDYCPIDFRRYSISVLQGALNIATDSCKCRIPAFALVGYPNSSTWILDNCYLSGNLGYAGLHGYCNPGPSINSVICSFSVDSSCLGIPRHCSTVKGLSTIFSYQSSLNSKIPIHINDFIISFVRHLYIWRKEESSEHEWCHSRIKLIECATKGWSIDSRRTNNIAHALRLLEGSKEKVLSNYWKIELSNPLYGSLLDPIRSVQIEVQWNEAEIATFLSMSNLDEDDKLAFNPIQSKYSLLRFKVDWDDSVPCSSLGLSLRCILAAYVKACTVNRDLLLSHILSQKVRKELIAADKPLCQKIIESLDSSTRSLVEAMDWDEDLPNMDVLDDIIEEVFSEFSPFPCESRAQHTTDQLSGKFISFEHSAPVGRLFSVMCMRLARMKTPVGMAALW